MNIYAIKEESAALQQIGICIDTSQRLKLQLGLLRLSQLANADQLLFWGKITTLSSPYYIAVGIDFKGHYAFPHKTFYYSKQNFIFQELPSPDQYNKNQANNFNVLQFTGNAQTILISLQEGEQTKQKVKEEGEGERDDSDQEKQIKTMPKNYTQEDRLSYTVNAIQSQAQLVPLGAFKMNTSHQIRYNQQFKASSPKHFQLNSFQHFRYPQTRQAKLKIQNVESVFLTDIFDVPQNPSFWSAQLNTTETIGTVRSLLWPGYISYVFFNRKSFGGVYFGYGLKQVDLPFMI